jgi:hypothetical protein
VIFSGSGQEGLPKFRKYIASKLAHLSGEDRRVTELVLLKYAELFHDDDYYYYYFFFLRVLVWLNTG